MKYELALKLKNAGFPQKWKDGVWYMDARMKEPELYCNDSEYGYYVDPKTTKSAILPTLEELINECGRRFGQLYKFVDVWESYGGELVNAKYGTWSIGVNGKTPLEAVANLWLKLQP